MQEALDPASKILRMTYLLLDPEHSKCMLCISMQWRRRHTLSPALRRLVSNAHCPRHELRLIRIFTAANLSTRASSILNEQLEWCEFEVSQHQSLSGHKSGTPALRQHRSPPPRVCSPRLAGAPTGDPQFATLQHEKKRAKFLKKGYEGGRKEEEKDPFIVNAVGVAAGRAGFGI